MPIVDLNTRKPLSDFRTELANLKSRAASDSTGSTPVPPQVEVQAEPTPLADLLTDLAKPLLSADEEVKASKTQGGLQWEPSKLMPRHREIMRRLLEGATYLEIAEAMGMHPVSIGLIARTAIFRTELARMESEADFQVIKRADQLSNEALDTLKTLMRKARSESLRKSCADSILDRAGYGKVEKRAIVAVTGEDVIRELNRRRREGDPMETRAEEADCS